MSRKRFNAQIAQYKTPTVEGNGVVQWQGGVKCHLPAATLYGACDPQDLTVCNNGRVELFGSNLLYPHSVGTTTQSGVTRTHYADGSIVISGTPTAAVGIMWYGPWTATEIIPPPGRYAFVNHDTTTDHTASYLVQCFDVVTRTHIKNIIATAANPYITIDKPYIIRVALNIWNAAYEMKNERYQMQFCPVGADGVIPPYGPYFHGGSVTAPLLRGVPDTAYVDEWDAVTGQGIRRCGAIFNYEGQAITTPYISSTGGLDAGADVVYGIPDTPFYSAPAARLIQPDGAGTLIQTTGAVASCPVAIEYVTHC